MAIFHFSAQMISRGAGRSAVAAAAYRAGDRLHDAHTGLDHDFTRRSDVRDTVIVTPDEAPAWAQERQSLWDAVNAAEKRGDAQTAREIEVSLPRELTVEQQRALVVGYVQRTFAAQGMVADIGLHEGHNPDQPNPHAHILLTTRPLTPEGFGPKERRWNRKDQLVAWRHEWAAALNQALAKAEHPERVDARSFKEQGIVDRAPTIHEGVAARAMERRGLPAERMQQNRDIKAYNATVIDLAAVRAEREALATALAAEASTAKPDGMAALQAAHDDLMAAIRDPQVAYWARVPASQRQAKFDAAFQSQWTNDAGLTYLQTYQAIQPAEAQVRTLQATVTVGDQAAQRLAAYEGWAGRKRKHQAFPHGRHRTEQGYEETFDQWQRKQQALVARGQQAAAQLPQAQDAVAAAYQAAQDFHVRLPHARATAWARLAPALQQADVAADRYHRLVMQATTQALKARAQSQGLPWRVDDPTRANMFASRVAHEALQHAFRTHGASTSAGGIAGLLNGIVQGLAQQDRSVAQRPHIADTRDLEQAVMNPLLDVTTRAQLQEILNKMKARENGGPEYER